MASSHRLPTVSASQALFDLRSASGNCVATGLSSFDKHLPGLENASGGGFEKGKVTELWGPSGAGKTAIALQAATNTVLSGGRALWLDAAAPLSTNRVQSVTKRLASSDRQGSENLNNRFNLLQISTLSHLLALVLHPPEALISRKIDILVVDNMHGLVDLDYPRYQSTTSAKSEQQKWQAGRRYAILGSLVSAFNKLSVLNSMAVVVTTGCSTRMRPDSGLGAALVPGVGGSEWDHGIWTRVIVFRDFMGRFAGVQKRQGKSLISREEVGEVGNVVGFDVAADGSLAERHREVEQEEMLVQQARLKPSPVKQRKRVYDEIADSEDENVDEYGWAEDDENAIAAEGLVEKQPRETAT